MDGSAEFPTFLKTRLPQGNKIRAYHVSTNPSPHPSLFAPAQGRSEEPTMLESHFLVISQSQTKSADSSGQLWEVPVLGVEVLIFTTTNLTTVFVSKADSTGLLERSANGTAARTSLAQTTVTAFLEFLVDQCRNRGRVVLSLFARSQNQYLFPGSIENITKHVLDDRQLIKWWCRALDSVASPVKDDVSWSVKAHVVVPGCDSGETRAFFPNPCRRDPASNSLWVDAYPLNLLVEDTSLPPRCLVPRLPDDPKSRFLDDLDAQRDENGTWRGIKTLDQFWDMMSYRQECSAGRLVGFVWVVFTPTTTPKNAVEAVNDENVRAPQTKQTSEQEQAVTADLTLASTVDQLRSIGRTSVSPPDSSTFVRRSKPSSVDAITTTANADLGLSNAKVETDQSKSRLITDGVHGALQTTQATTKSSMGYRLLGGITISAENYQVLMDLLLQLDFAGKDLAVDSTQKWCQKAMNLAGVLGFGVEIEGTAAVSEVASVVDTTATANTAINVITTGIRKKRKAEHAEIAIHGQAGADMDAKATVNTLATNLMRKKPKP